MNKSTQKHIQPTVKISTPLIVSPATDKFKVLPSPVKSFSDKKEYKVIRLENGLTACLIYDPQKPVSSDDASTEESSESESETESETTTESETESIVSEPPEDEEDAIRTKVKKGSGEIKLAAAALCIGVGSFSDPKDVPGLAHFLEHMVFMGSEKFPQENDFDAFIKKHGGSDNASTDYETTTFYFECFEKHLYLAMDKFAQFFVSPLMKRESMARERESIESEFQMAAPSDDYRKEQLLVSLADKESPVNSFSWGNLVTLKENISDDALYEMLHQFRRRHYSAHRITVAVQARLPLDELEKYVVTCFSSIPNNNIPPLDFSPFSESVFNNPHFKRLFYVKPVRDICQVDLTWVMPSLLHMYKSKPHVYVSWLLGHEGKGSLLSYLKRKVWALSLFAGNGESGAEFNSIYASFSVNIVLTKQGFAHLKEVIEAVFSYLKMLKTVGPCERIFKEIQTIEEMSFRFEEDESASDNVEDLVESMQVYPPADYLTGSELFFEYNPQAIKMVLHHLVPDRMNILVLSSDVPDDITYDKTETWFKTQYTDREIPKDWTDAWASPRHLPDFYLPEPNPYLTTDFSLLAQQPNIPIYPEKVLQSSLVELWYRKDQRFLLPSAYYHYYFITPLSVESAQSACMLQMFVAFASIDLAEEAYPAQIAELVYGLSACEKGFCLKVSGYNQKLPVLIDLIVKYLKSVGSNLTLDLFEAVKEKQMKSFYNGFLKPSKLCKDLRLSILQNNYYSLLDRYEAVSGITYAMMRRFCDDVFRQLYVQVLIQGNVTKEIAINTTTNLIQKLNCERLPSVHYPQIFINEIPRGEHCCRIMSFNKNNSNSIITNYYQCGLMNIMDNIILEFIMLLIEEPLFDILRTKEQLGYSVYCSIRDTYGILGYTITVNAQADKHSAEYVDSRIEAFLKHTSKLLRKMNEKKFMQTKRDLIKVKQVVDVDLEDEVDRNWDEIVNQKYMFERLAKEIEAIQELKIGEVRRWWDHHNMYGKQDNFKKLSVQVVGHAPVGESEMREESPQRSGSRRSSTERKDKSEEEFKLELIENKEEVKTNKKSGGYFVTDIKVFREQLRPFPLEVKS